MRELTVAEVPAQISGPEPAFGDVAEPAWEADYGARAPYATFRRSAEQIDAESERGDDGVVGSTWGTV